MSIEFGFCAEPASAGHLARAGIRAIEVRVNTICAWTDEELRRNLETIREAGLRFETCNCLIGGFSLYEDEGFEKTGAHLDRVLPRLAEAGMKLVVFGSGSYRRVPEGMEREAARERILEFLRLLSDRIGSYGLTAVVEPLNRDECNILTTTAEAAEYVRTLNRPNIRLLVDYYHFLREGERLPAIENCRGILAHAHVAHPIGRVTPEPGDGIDYRGFLDALKAIGYEGLVVAESWSGLEPDVEYGGFARVMSRALG